MSLQAGVGRCVITPPVEIGMAGFAGRGPAERVHDELYATTLALEWDEIRCLIITLDLIGVSSRLVNAIRDLVQQRTGVLGSHVALCCSHTHYGPTTGAYEPDDLPGMESAYVRNLEYLVAGSAQVAMADLQPVKVGAGSGLAHIGVNRRERRPNGDIVLGQNPNGACDREVKVVRLETEDGGPLAALVNFACHPVSPGHSVREISADYIGPMRDLVEAATGARCLFLQGAAGNINPIEMRPSFEPAERFGTSLGEEVIRVFGDISSDSRGPLAVESCFANLPPLTFPSIEEGERTVAELREQFQRLRATRDPGGALYWAESRLNHAEQRLESKKSGIPLAPIPAEMMAIRFADVALVTAPGEIFCETGMEVKQHSPIPNTCFVGYSNGSIGYVPTPESYSEGGYEVTHGCSVYPEAAGIIRDTALEMLGRVT